MAHSLWEWALEFDVVFADESSLAFELSKFKVACIFQSFWIDFKGNFTTTIDKSAVAMGKMIQGRSFIALMSVCTL